MEKMEGEEGGYQVGHRTLCPTVVAEIAMAVPIAIVATAMAVSVAIAMLMIAIFRDYGFPIFRDCGFSMLRGPPPSSLPVGGAPGETEGEAGGDQVGHRTLCSTVGRNYYH